MNKLTKLAVAGGLSLALAATLNTEITANADESNYSWTQPSPHRMARVSQEFRDDAIERSLLLAGIDPGSDVWDKLWPQLDEAFDTYLSISEFGGYVLFRGVEFLALTRDLAGAFIEQTPNFERRLSQSRWQGSEGYNYQNTYDWVVTQGNLSRNELRALNRILLDVDRTDYTERLANAISQFQFEHNLYDGALVSPLTFRLLQASLGDRWTQALDELEPQY
ncbi:MAG: hypothetical protein FWE31_04945 [Firmicutes bacterium]|nr:hypothetical protein [Bacillota bacterium]